MERIGKGLCLFLVLLASTRGQECPTRTYDCSGDLTYPKFDGSCNNFGNPLWGAGDTPQFRLLQADYGPGDSLRGTNSSTLPSARVVSNELNDADTLTLSGALTGLHVLWGQFLSHDISKTPMIADLDCDCDDPDDGCANIPIPEDDSQREKGAKPDKTCFGLPRSREAEGLFGCYFSQREQLTDMSSFIDATQVYGKTPNESAAIRDPTPGVTWKLYSGDPVLNTRHRLLPEQDDIADTDFASTIDCPADVHVPINRTCFVAGDVRLNENTGLMAIHTVWMRYHNLVAKKLAELNPHWDDEKVFNEARMVIIALNQIITYREYLPPLLGDGLMQSFNLELKTSGYWNGYDPLLNPTVTNAFSTAAFRFGHSMLAGFMSRRRANFNEFPDSKLGLQESFFNTAPLAVESTRHGVGGFMRGFMKDPAEEMDSSFTHDVRNELTKKFGNQFGGDLFAFNIQRGRDHGLPGYNAYRELCGLERAVSFGDLLSEMDQAEIDKLSAVYGDPDDIDLYAGGVAEKFVDGGQVGPTFACLMGIGFRALRAGDRYWHERQNSPSSFTGAQLQAMRAVKFSRVMCDVTEYMRVTKEYPFLVSSADVDCEDLTELDLASWEETPGSKRKRRGTSGAEEVDWTQFFYVSSIHETDEQLVAIIRQKTDIGLCENVLKVERKLDSAGYHRVRFACESGSIETQGLSKRISQNTQFTEWVQASKIGVGISGLAVETGGLCGGASSPIDLEVMLIDGDAMQVYEIYRKERGVRCLDYQNRPACRPFKVRVLCK